MITRDLSDLELDVKVRIYLEHHQLSNDLMNEIADRILNVNTIRKTIKSEIPSIILDFHKNNTINIIA